VDPERIAIQLEDDEAEYLQSMEIKFQPNLYVIVGKDIVCKLLGKSLEQFRTNLDQTSERRRHHHPSQQTPFAKINVDRVTVDIPDINPRKSLTTVFDENNRRSERIERAVRSVSRDAKLGGLENIRDVARAETREHQTEARQQITLPG
jgi:hypothetical protein